MATGKETDRPTTDRPTTDPDIERMTKRQRTKAMATIKILRKYLAVLEEQLSVTDPDAPSRPTETSTQVMYLAGGIIKRTRVTTTERTMVIVTKMVIPLTDDEERGQNLRPRRGGECDAR